MKSFRSVLASIMLVATISFGSVLPESEARAQPPESEESLSDRAPPSAVQAPTQKSSSARRKNKCRLKRVRCAFRRLASRRGK